MASSVGGRVKAPFSGTANRDSRDKVNEKLSIKDWFAKSDGLSDDTAAINTSLNILAALSPKSFTVEIPYGTVYTEGSLSIPSNVAIVDYSKAGVVRILNAARASTGTITNGGLVVKSAGISGVLLRVHDNGVSAAPYLEARNEVTGALAGLSASFTKLTEFIDITEMSTPAAPAANVARLFIRDNGSAKTQLCVRFNTGAVQVLSTEP